MKKTPFSEHDAIVGYLFTSGTTGFPKAVPMAFNRLWSVLQVALIDRWLFLIFIFILFVFYIFK